MVRTIDGSGSQRCPTTLVRMPATDTARDARPPSLIHTCFPGRIIGGTALVAGPVIWFTGLLLRYLAYQTAGFTPEQRAAFDRQPFAAAGQLATYQANPALTTAGYACYVLGAIVLCPAFIALARRVGRRAPWLGCVGGTLVLFGLFSRVHSAGVDNTALRLVGELGLERATEVTLRTYQDISYGLWRVPVTASFGIYLGALTLALGALLAGVFGTGRLALFLFASSLWSGVLKESSIVDGVLSAAALGVVLIPLGIHVLRDGVPAPRDRPAGTGRPRLLSW